MVTIARRETLRPSSNASYLRIRPPGAAARALAHSYLQYVSAVWRGDKNASAFATWLDRFWCADLPPAPEAAPDAHSPHGGAGHGIAWFEVAGEVRGYVGGVRGGYRVPVGAIPAPRLTTTGRCGR